VAEAPQWKTWQIYLNFKLLISNSEFGKFDFPSVYSDLMEN